ncbi:MAG: hypothetical protein KAS02_02205 [Candidatus Pacebacteria bacterium]|nr:hypothetical protein [Candidatus Paceibacterota bacterium]
MTFIEDLQNKSDKQKKIILFSVVGILMVIVFFIWIFQFKNSLKIKSEISNDSLIFTSELNKNITGVYENSVKKFSELKEIFKEN